MRIPKWGEFQHYRQRRPPWIKLHRSLLDDEDFHALPVASRALAPCLWLVASEQADGSLPASVERLAWRLRMPLSEFLAAFKPLVEKGFVEDASDALAQCKQDAIPEERQRQSTEAEVERESEARPVGRANPLVAGRRADLESELLKLVGQIAEAEDLDPTEVIAQLSAYKGRSIMNPATMSDDRLAQTLRAAKERMPKAPTPIKGPTEEQLFPFVSQARRKHQHLTESEVREIALEWWTAHQQRNLEARMSDQVGRL